eukprot:gene795-1271_t
MGGHCHMAVMVAKQINGADVYLYYSDVYTGYWIIGADLQSKQYYGYAYDQAADPTAMTSGWQGSNIAGVKFTSISTTTQTPTMSPTPIPTAPPSVATTGSPLASDATTGPTAGPTTSPTVSPTGSPTESPITKTPTSSPTAPGEVVYQCPAGYTNVVAELDGCEWMSSYGCQDADQNDGKCTHCGKSAGQGRCYYPKFAYAVQTATSPFMMASCEAYGCTADMLDDDKCNWQCNKPECGFDNGRCCSETYDPYTQGDTHPQVCFDPEHSENHDTWRFEFNVPKCRTMPLQQAGSPRSRLMPPEVLPASSSFVVRFEETGGGGALAVLADAEDGLDMHQLGAALQPAEETAMMASMSAERKVERMESALGVEGPGNAEDAEDGLDMHQLGAALQPAEETAMMASMSAERKVERMESALGVEGPGNAEDAEDGLEGAAQACYNGEDNAWRTLSQMYMDTCVMPQWGMGRCQGASTEYGMTQIAFEGVPTDDCFPYAYYGDGTQHFDTTSSKATPREPTTDSKYYPQYVTGRNIDSLTLSPTNKDKIKERLKAQGPLNMRMDVYSSFMDKNVEKQYSNPATPYDRIDVKSQSYDGGHALVLSGYGEYTDGDGETRSFWVSENSWGNDWADGGMEGFAEKEYTIYGQEETNTLYVNSSYDGCDEAVCTMNETTYTLADFEEFEPATYANTILKSPPPPAESPASGTPPPDDSSARAAPAAWTALMFMMAIAAYGLWQLESDPEFNSAAADAASFPVHATLTLGENVSASDIKILEGALAAKNCSLTSEGESLQSLLAELENITHQTITL